MRFYRPPLNTYLVRRKSVVQQSTNDYDIDHAACFPCIVAYAVLRNPPPPVLTAARAACSARVTEPVYYRHIFAHFVPLKPHKKSRPHHPTADPLYTRQYRSKNGIHSFPHLPLAERIYQRICRMNLSDRTDLRVAFLTQRIYMSNV